MSIATEVLVQDLKKRVEALEAEVAELKKARDEPAPPKDAARRRNA
jgi:hypothetical protein